MVHPVPKIIPQVIRTVPFYFKQNVTSIITVRITFTKYDSRFPPCRVWVSYLYFGTLELLVLWCVMWIWLLSFKSMPWNKCKTSSTIIIFNLSWMRLIFMRDLLIRKLYEIRVGENNKQVGNFFRVINVIFYFGVWHKYMSINFMTVSTLCVFLQVTQCLQLRVQTAKILVWYEWS